jgi:hypothetical protein
MERHRIVSSNGIERHRASDHRLCAWLSPGWLISREASIAKSRCTWNGEESPQTPIYFHHSSRWLTLGPHQARTMGSCHMPNDEDLPYAEQCGIAIRRTMHSQAFYTRFYCPSQTGQKPPRAQLQASARAQNHQKCSSGTFLLQLESVSKARPKGLSNRCHRRGIDPAKSF